MVERGLIADRQFECVIDLIFHRGRAFMALDQRRFRALADHHERT
jgi:hypothetical protein